MTADPIARARALRDNPADLITMLNNIAASLEATETDLHAAIDTARERGEKLEAVAALHKPVPGQIHDQECYECTEVTPQGYLPVSWPCPTARALGVE